MKTKTYVDHLITGTLVAIFVTGLCLVHGVIMNYPHTKVIDCRSMALDTPVICFEE